MNIVIKECEFYNAFTDEEAFNILIEKVMEPMRVVIPCTCNPPCLTLNEEQKQILQKRVNDRVEELKRKAAIEKGMTLEDMCAFIAGYLKEVHKKELTAEQVYNVSPTRSMSHYLDMYEEAVYHMKKDFYERSAIEYFTERLEAVLSDPALKGLAIRYQNTIGNLEKNNG